MVNPGSVGCPGYDDVARIRTRWRPGIRWRAMRSSRRAQTGTASSSVMSLTITWQFTLGGKLWPAAMGSLWRRVGSNSSTVAQQPEPLDPARQRPGSAGCGPCRSTPPQVSTDPVRIHVRHRFRRHLSRPATGLVIGVSTSGRTTCMTVIGSLLSRIRFARRSGQRAECRLCRAQ